MWEKHHLVGINLLLILCKIDVMLKKLFYRHLFFRCLFKILPIQKSFERGFCCRKSLMFSMSCYLNPFVYVFSISYANFSSRNSYSGCHRSSSICVKIFCILYCVSIGKEKFFTSGIRISF